MTPSDVLLFAFDGPVAKPPAVDGGADLHRERPTGDDAVDADAGLPPHTHLRVDRAECVDRVRRLLAIDDRPDVLECAGIVQLCAVDFDAESVGDILEQL